MRAAEESAGLWRPQTFRIGRQPGRFALCQPCEVCLHPITDERPEYMQRGRERRYQHDACFVGDRPELPHGRCRVCMERPALAIRTQRVCVTCYKARSR